MTQEHPAHASLYGLQVGDAFGAQIRLPGDHPDVVGRVLPPAPWAWSDDTEMACSVFAVLTRHGRIDQDDLAWHFQHHFDPDRGYGSGAERVLLRYRRGESWRDVAPSVFGNGSWGNGGAMRVAPLGAWFGPDLDAVVAEAARSAEVTHAHPEGVAGAVAVAVAAALACTTSLTGGDLLRAVAARVAPSEVRRRIEVAAGSGGPAEEVARELGNGREVSAADTVPLALWLAAHHFGDFPGAMWTAARVAEDIDTVCAMTGGVLTARTGSGAIPVEWWNSCEPLPLWFTGPPAPPPDQPQVVQWDEWQVIHPPPDVWSGGMTMVCGDFEIGVPNWVSREDALDYARAVRDGKNPKAPF
ncbi:ADP-ribosylglycohydrolase family protein [Amycolatopsis albispora]|uniref:ADP-ribosylglycohydrolase family protein n=1 Tax=Amycolatopsis albispora TaxID=1804986 RepID=UPI000DE1CFB7|nr:ADP-ribosylglycohydrolase family protein [Amycolatopsis albispora]